MTSPATASPSPGRTATATEEASGSVNRLLRPDSVRHMSVTTAMQGHTTAHHDTQRDNSRAAREPGYAQATGRLCRWWQVLGSNQRRLSRRFYSPSLLAEADAAGQHIRRSRRRPGPSPSAMRPCVLGLVHGRGRKTHGRGRWERLRRPSAGFSLLTWHFRIPARCCRHIPHHRVRTRAGCLGRQSVGLAGVAFFDGL